MTSKGNWFTKWARSREDQILDLFASIKGATTGGEEAQYVFVPGTRTDRALLVAHCDTVWGDDEEIRPRRYKGGVWASGRRGIGIGADDRAGCAALWALRECGHSMLITSGEECGCIGAREIAWEHSDMLSGHSFAIQFDRRGASDIVTYQVGTPDFQDYVSANMPKFQVASGTYTDIVELCPAMGVCGANLSIGYYGEHTGREYLVEWQWKRTVRLVRDWLSSPLMTYAYEPPLPSRDMLNWRDYDISTPSLKRFYDPDGVVCCSECGQPIIDPVTYRGKAWCDDCALWDHDTRAFYGDDMRGGVN